MIVGIVVVSSAEFSPPISFIRFRTSSCVACPDSDVGNEDVGNEDIDVGNVDDVEDDNVDNNVDDDDVDDNVDDNVNVGVDVDDTHASVSSVVDVSSIMIRHIIL